MSDETDEAPTSEEGNENDATWGDATLSGPLKPRHRRLAELHAQGYTNNEIVEKLGYSVSRVSILLSNHKVKEEIERVRERIYQDTIAKRLKDLGDPAMNVIEECLTDRSNRWKENLKADMAKWVVEKLDGKATQKFDVGENTLSLFLDRLDAAKAGGHPIVDITPQEKQALLAPNVENSGENPVEIVRNEEEREEDRLREWVNDLSAPRVTKK